MTFPISEGFIEWLKALNKYITTHISNHFLTKCSDNSLQRGPYLVQLCLDLHHICLHFVDASPGEKTQSRTLRQNCCSAMPEFAKKKPPKNPTRVELPRF